MVSLLKISTRQGMPRSAAIALRERIGASVRGRHKGGIRRPALCQTKSAEQETQSNNRANPLAHAAILCWEIRACLLSFDFSAAYCHSECPPWNNPPRFDNRAFWPRVQVEAKTALAVVCRDEVKRATRGVRAK
jgi:hypothetical protein